MMSATKSNKRASQKNKDLIALTWLISDLLIKHKLERGEDFPKPTELPCEPKKPVE